MTQDFDQILLVLKSQSHQPRFPSDMVPGGILPETRHTSAFDQWFRNGGTLFRECDPESPSSTFAASIVSDFSDPERWKIPFSAFYTFSDPDTMDALIDSSTFEKSQVAARGRCCIYRNCGEIESGVTEADIIPELNRQMLSALVHSPKMLQNANRISYERPKIAESILHLADSIDAKSIHDLAVLLIDEDFCDFIVFGLDNAQGLRYSKEDTGLFAQLFRLCKLFPRKVRVVASATRTQDLGIIGTSARRLSRDSEYQGELDTLSLRTTTSSNSVRRSRSDLLRRVSFLSTF